MAKKIVVKIELGHLTVIGQLDSDMFPPQESGTD